MIKETSKIVRKRLKGRLRLEHSKKRGYIVSFVGRREVFWIKFNTLKEIIEDDFGPIVRLTSNDPKNENRQ